MDAVTMGGLTANGRASGKCGIDDDDDEEKEFVRIDRFGFSLCVQNIISSPQTSSFSGVFTIVRGR